MWRKKKEKNVDCQSEPILTIKSKNGGDRKDTWEGNKAEENPPEKLENSVSLNNLENKLAHRGKLQMCKGRKLDKQNKDLFSNIHRRKISANAHFKVFYERLKSSSGYG